MRTKLLTLLATCTAVVGIGLLPTMAAAEEPAAPAAPLVTGCNSGNHCSWSGTFYTGTRVEIQCIGGFHGVGFTAFSAKNACANKKVELYYQEGEVIRFKACMNPGGERPEPGRFNTIYVGAEGSRC